MRIGEVMVKSTCLYWGATLMLYTKNSVTLESQSGRINVSLPVGYPRINYRRPKQWVSKL